jgi:hypothetical protein
VHVRADRGSRAQGNALRLHFRKEEDIQLPVFDAAAPEVTAAVLEPMETLTEHAHEHGH